VSDYPARGVSQFVRLGASWVNVAHVISIDVIPMAGDVWRVEAFLTRGEILTVSDHESRDAAETAAKQVALLCSR
jgi:hypothetical protein